MAKVDYVTFDDNTECPMVRLGCMKCNDTIGTREIKDDKFYFKHWSHLARFPMVLSDGSIAEFLLCDVCVRNVQPGDFDLLEKTLYHGWMTEQKRIYQGKAEYVEAMKNYGSMVGSKKVLKRGN